MTKYIIVLPCVCFYLAQQCFCPWERLNKAISFSHFIERSMLPIGYSRSELSFPFPVFQWEVLTRDVTRYKATQPVLLLTVFCLV